MDSLRRLVEAYGLEWEGFAKALEELDREAFVALMERAKRHAEAGAQVDTPAMFETVVMSILVEHQRELSQLLDQVLPDTIKTCPRCNSTRPLEDFVRGTSEQERVGILCRHCQEALGFTH